MSNRGVLNLKESNNNTLVYEKVKFAGRHPTWVIISMINGKMHTVRLLFEPKAENQAIELYQDIKRDLNNKYFVSNDDFANFKYPYEEGDGYETLAIKSGSATYAAYWFFVRPGEDDPEIQNGIWLEIDTDLFTILAYQDGRLIKGVVEKIKGDY